ELRLALRLVGVRPHERAEVVNAREPGVDGGLRHAARSHVRRGLASPTRRRVDEPASPAASCGPMQTHERLFIGRTRGAPATSATIDVVSPHTEDVIARVPEAREADVDRAVAAARAAFDEGPWPRLTPLERADLMAALVERLQARADEIAVTITREMGSPISF